MKNRIGIRKKITELKEYTKSTDVDLTAEIEKLEERLRKLEKEIYENIKPWDRVQIARHSNVQQHGLYLLIIHRFL